MVTSFSRGVIAWLGRVMLLSFGCSRAAASTPSLPAADGGASDATGFAVVELFTSEGCSSCPPADDVLRELAARAARTGQRIYPISFHVDYWNELGWIDPYSTASFTDRQQLYARALGQRGMYTPQMIVNGRVAFVGSDAARARGAVEAARRGPRGATIELEVKTEDGETSVDFSVSGAPPGDVLELAIVQESAETQVRAGENAGKTLRHASVVRGLRQVALIGGKAGRAAFPRTVGSRGPAAVVAFVQDPETMAIHGAVRVAL